MPKNTKRTITEEQKQILLENPNVEDVGKVSIYYTKAFKERALELYYQGYTPKKIFIDTGFDLNIIGKTAPATCLSNWRFHDKAKKKKTTKYLAKQTKKNSALKSVIEENKYLRAENEFLKKLQALEEIFG
jgi:transposase